MAPNNPEDDHGEAPPPAESSPPPPDPVALQKRVEYLEWLTGMMAADLTLIRERNPAVFRSLPVPGRQAAPPPQTTTAGVPQIPIAGAHHAAVYAQSVSTEPPQTMRPARTESLESQLGSRVLSKVAIVLLLFGVAWFLKWAFDNRWIGPSGRIIAGLVAGVAVVIWSERFRKHGMAAFSYGLKAVGTGVLYLSLWAAFHVYHLIPSTPALLAMIAVTVWNAYMAWAQDAELLAGYALLGGYLTPILLSTGGNHEIFLFTYLFVIAVCVAVLVRMKPWRRLLLGALPVTAIFFIAWFAAHFSPDQSTRTLFFAMLLWATFAAVPLVARERGVIVDVLTPQGTALFGALSVYATLSNSGGDAAEPWWAVLFSALYLAMARLRRERISSAIHLSLAIVFLTVAIPLKANGRGITAGWLAEAVVLLWVGSLESMDPRTRKTLRLLAYGALALGVGGALFGPSILGERLHPFTNRNFLTSMGAIVALGCAVFLENRSKSEEPSPSTPSASAPSSSVPSAWEPGNIAAIAFVVLNLVLLVAMYREITAYFLDGVSAAAWRDGAESAGFAYSGWMMLQGSVLLIAGFAWRIQLARWLGLILLGVTVVKAFLFDMSYLGTGYRVFSYLGLGVVLMAVSFAYQKDMLGLRQVAAGNPAPEEEVQR
ncbi:MAG TPA: DUF2339 domain-containing protein [Acidobacteriaceae bacterium]|jgi:uncharacterized membrane protein